MSIIQGQNAEASDFISASERDATPANDAGRVSKLDENGNHDPAFCYARDADEFVFGQNGIVANEALYVSDGGETNTELAQTSSSSDISAYTDASTDRIAQSFTVPANMLHSQLKSLLLRLEKTGTPTGSLTIDLYLADNSTNKPTGSVLSTGSLAYASIAAANDYEVPMSDYSLIEGEEYIFVVTPGAGVSGANLAKVFQNANVSGVGGKIWLSTDSGATWTDADGGNGIAAGNDLRFSIICEGIAGRVYKTSAANAEDCDNFIGFAAAAGGVGQTRKVIAGAGIVSGFSGLAPGVTYFLSDTRGAIASSVGSVSRKIGRAVSATKLLMIRDNV